ncbi:MAG TPA: hypothetical protein VIR45_07830, partial [Kiloniellaceae bacterium]
MSGYHQESTVRSGLVGHSLKLAVAVVLSGLAVVFLLDREGAGTSAPAGQVAGTAPPQRAA